MAKGQKSKRTPKVAEEEKPEDAPAPEAPEAELKEEAALAKREADAGEEAGQAPADQEDGRAPDLVAAGDTEGTDDEEEVAAAHLGTERYVISAFFAAGMLLAYITGRLIHTVWSTIANQDWFSRTVPALAAVADEDKSTYGTVIGGIIALVVILRTYRNPEIRTWADEVASELTKVKWPTKKEVTNSTFVVITATTVATLYLALLDRFWAFVTNIVYGDGS